MKHNSIAQAFAALALPALTFNLWATVVSYDWPTEPGQALLSDRYAVRVIENGQVTKVKTLMSLSWTEEGGGPDIFRDRTFSWAPFSSDFETPLIVEVEKIYGEGAAEVEIVPSGYNLIPQLSEDGKTVRFELDRSRYASVNFKTADNLKAADGLITHCLMIFADNMETEVPDKNDPGVHIFGPQSTQAEVEAATLTYFEAGFHDFAGQFEDANLQLKPDMQIYLEGGVFITGKMMAHGRADRAKIFGRGAISGREFPWEPGQPISALIEAGGDDIMIDGIYAMDNNKHGIVPGFSPTIRNAKVWGWHYNSDGFRPWGGTVDHCFTRPTDDAFYVDGRNLIVTDTVIWQSFNGAVVTCGWGSPSNPYDTQDFLMKDCHIIYPEWNGIGNNNGILASQLPYNAESKRIRFENVRVDGNVSAITNLKRNEDQEKAGEPGGIFEVVFKDFVVTGNQYTYNYNRSVQSASKSLIRGDDEFRIENVTFENLTIEGTPVTAANAADYFEIDATTTANISFTYTPPSSDQETIAVAFDRSKKKRDLLRKGAPSLQLQHLQRSRELAT
ncbi:hypothetical protein QEH56_07545 [Pelagicoccus enzymogenes]|uniref:hypothetical protein n=1 Tax=Pelagicoccus enzymogenes TaxID=2773457 RepID=UPI00280D9353|nr:hypothetical protein [Pelagicoccus enzymogenes]MDQ8197996.1 hypothetical protein [Pelagicoccus enzymogenes]